jgi:hypothetical protein
MKINLDKKKKILTLTFADPFPEKFYHDLKIGNSDKKRYDRFMTMLDVSRYFPKKDHDKSFPMLDQAREYYKEKLKVNV